MLIICIISHNLYVKRQCLFCLHHNLIPGWNRLCSCSVSAEDTSMSLFSVSVNVLVWSIISLTCSSRWPDGGVVVLHSVTLLLSIPPLQQLCTSSSWANKYKPQMLKKHVLQSFEYSPESYHSLHHGYDMWYITLPTVIRSKLWTGNTIDDFS